MTILNTVISAVLFVTAINAKNILLIPPNIPSHILEITAVGEQLAKNGNNVFMVLKSVTRPPSVVLNSGIQFIRYESSNNIDPFHDTMFQKQSLELYMTSSLVQKIRFITSFSRQQCDDILSKKTLDAKIIQKNIDFAIVGASVATNCLFVIPHRLEIPYGGITAIPMPYVSNILLLPSLAPIRHSQLHDDMTLVDRVKNTIMTVSGLAIFNYYNDDQAYQKYTPDKPYESLETLASKSRMWLIEQDNIMDYPNIRPPNVFYVGGLLTSPAKKLPRGLHNIAQKAKHGLIVVSFGTTITHLPANILQKFADSFRHLPQEVIWRHLGSTENVSVPENVHIREWIPQNDLLGHPNTKLFITHCGNNGQYEALYHGVPMIGFPMTAEQPFNAERMQYKNFGIKMELKNFRAEVLHKNIGTVIHDANYKHAIETASALFKDRRNTPREEAAYWVEHVIKHGSRHLHMPASHLRWYQIILLDVIFVIIVATTAIMITVFAILRCCLWTCDSMRKL